MDLKCVLAATDFSDASGRAVERATLLARQHGSALHLIHVIPAISWKLFGRALVEHPLITEKHLYDAAKRRLQQEADACRQRLGIEASCTVEIGRPHEGIAEHAEKCGADLVVLGPHGEGLAREMFVGSTARRLLNKTGHSTLIVRSEARTPYQRILAGIDFSDASRHALEGAMRIAPEAEVHAMHVYEVLFEGKMQYAGVEENVIEQYRDAAAAEAAIQMREFLVEMEGGNRVGTILRKGHVGRSLLDEAQFLQADLIAMGKHARSELGEMLLGSATEHVLSQGDRDLLLIR